MKGWVGSTGAKYSRGKQKVLFGRTKGRRMEGGADGVRAKNYLGDPRMGGRRESSMDGWNGRQVLAARTK